MSNESLVKVAPPRASWKAKVVLLLSTLLVISIVLEVTLRVNYALESRKARTQAKANKTPAGEFWAIYDPQLGYRQNPKFGDLNADGLRDHPVNPKAGRYRVLFLGDSVAFYGDSVDDTFVAHMRSDLSQSTSNLDIIDAGIKGYTNYQEVEYLKKYGLSFEPDVVGVQFCLNDVHKFLHSFEIQNGQIVNGSYRFSEEAIESVQTPPRSLLQRVADKSALLSWLKSNVGIVGKAISWKATKGYSFDYRVDISTAWRDEGWKNIERQFGELADLSRTRNFKLFVVVVPVASQYRPEYLARNRDYVLKPQSKLQKSASV